MSPEHFFMKTSKCYLLSGKQWQIESYKLNLASEKEIDRIMFVIKGHQRCIHFPPTFLTLPTEKIYMYASKQNCFLWYTVLPHITNYSSEK